MKKQPTTRVFVPRATIFVFIYCLLRRKRIVCISASRFLRFSKYIDFFRTQDIKSYYAKHAFYEKLIIGQCNPKTPRDCFAYQHYIFSSLVYLIPFYILSEDAKVILIAPFRLKSSMFPESTVYIFSVRDLVARFRQMRVFSKIYLSLKGLAAEVSYLQFEGSAGYKISDPWKNFFHWNDIEFYRSVYSSLLSALERISDLEMAKYVYTRRYRESVEYSENLVFEYCEAKKTISVSEQERAFCDSEIDYCFSNYHEYRYWDYESRKIHQQFCHGNNVVRSSLLNNGDTIKASLCTALGDSRAPCVLAFPAQIVVGGFNNSGHNDVHLAAEFAEFLKGLRDAGFAVTIKLKDPKDSSYFEDFVCVTSERGSYLDLTSKYDYFISCGYTTPGIDLKVKGFRSFYFYPPVSGDRLYSDMTISNVQQFISMVNAA